MDAINILAVQAPNAAPLSQSNIPQAGDSSSGKDVFNNILNKVADKNGNTQQVVESQPTVETEMNILTAAVAAILPTVNSAATTETELTPASGEDVLQLTEENTDNTADNQLLLAVMAVLGIQPPAVQTPVANAVSANTVLNITSTLNTKDSNLPLTVLQEKILGTVVNVKDIAVSPDSSQASTAMTASLPNEQILQPESNIGKPQTENQRAVLSAVNTVQTESSADRNSIDVTPATAAKEATVNTIGTNADSMSIVSQPALKPLVPSFVPNDANASVQQIIVNPSVQQTVVNAAVQAGAETKLRVAASNIDNTVSTDLSGKMDVKSNQPVSLTVMDGQVKIQPSGLMYSDTSKEEGEQNSKQDAQQQPTVFGSALAQHTERTHTAGHTAFPDVQKPHDAYNVAGQIVEQAKLIKQPFAVNNSEMLIKLRPDHLGELTLKVAVENGVVSASFHTNNAEVRSIIEASLPQLKQDLATQGLKVDNVDVYAGLGDFFSDSQSQQGELFRQQQQQQQQAASLKNLKAADDFVQAVEETANPSTLGADGVDYRV